MAKEITNPSKFRLFPEGEYDFVVAEKPEKRKTEKGKIFRIWKFTTIVDGEKKEYRTVMFPWDSGPLLIELGGELQEDGTIEWDDEEVIGKRVQGRITHEKGNDGKVRDVLTVVQDEEIPF